MSDLIAFVINGTFGKVSLWIQDFVDEVCRFPSGKHDDQVDAVPIAVSMLTRANDKKAYGF